MDVGLWCDVVLIERLGPGELRIADQAMILGSNADQVLYSMRQFGMVVDLGVLVGGVSRRARVHNFWR